MPDTPAAPLADAPVFPFADPSYARALPGLVAPWQPTPVPAPRLAFLNEALALELGLDPAALATPAGADVLAGNRLPAGAEPVAQAYAGHQFGRFSPRLGDGRALLLGEVIDRQGVRRDIAFKGSGPTPFSRGGDGKAAIGPMLREALIGEAMHALGIPTTRALAVTATGEPVYRERVMPGAVLTRVAASHLRVGSFEYAASRRAFDSLRHLADYAIARHDPDLADGPDRYLALLARVAQRQALLIAQWMNVGFIHGVMNTDNMAISGETIDYGPCAFMEAYDPATVFSSIDQGGRYAYGNQPGIAQWNLARLAEALLPLVIDAPVDAASQQAPDDDTVQRAIADATAIISAFPAQLEAALLAGRRAKLGLQRATPEDKAPDQALVDDWLALLQRHEVDFTLAWHRLGEAARDADEAALYALFGFESGSRRQEADGLGAWLGRWRARCASEDQAGVTGVDSAADKAADKAEDKAAEHGARRAQRMHAVNPFIIPRNHLVEEALAAATNDDDLVPFERLLDAVKRPFIGASDGGDQRDLARYGEPAAREVTACYQTFCGT